MIKNTNIKGQSISEFLVTMAVLVPLLLTMASFANLLTLSTETVEAGRLAAWERTVYSDDVNAAFGDAEITEAIQNNINSIYLTRNHTDFGPGKTLNTGALPSIVDRSVNGGQPVSLQAPTTNLSGVGMVNDGSRLVNQLGFSSSDLETLQSPEISIALSSDYSLLKAVSFEHYRQSEYTDPDNIPNDEVAGRNQFNLSSHSALIAGGWMPNSNQLQAVTSSAAFDESGLSAFEAGNALFDFAGFDEAGLATGDGGYSTSAVNAETILPSDL